MQSLQKAAPISQVTTPLLEHRAQVKAYGDELFRICGIEFTRTTELQRQVCGAFLFGVTYAHGRWHKLTPLGSGGLVTA